MSRYYGNVGEKRKEKNRKNAGVENLGKIREWKI